MCRVLVNLTKGLGKEVPIGEVPMKSLIMAAQQTNIGKLRKCNYVPVVGLALISQS